MTTKHNKDATTVTLENKHTGFSNKNLVVVISKNRNVQFPQIKVYLQSDMTNKSPCLVVPVSKQPSVLSSSNLELPSEDISEVNYWVYKNHVLLLNFWKDSKTSTPDNLLNNVETI